MIRRYTSEDGGKHVLAEVPDTSFEAWLSKYMIPIPIDQRYNEKAIKYVHDIVSSLN